MLKRIKPFLIAFFAILIVLGLIFIGIHPQVIQGHPATRSASSSSSITKKVPPKMVKRPTDFWKNPSEKKTYPVVSNYPNFSVEVSISKQRVYLKNKDQVLYTMLASTGKNGGTPKGNFKIEHERGQRFFNKESGEGAKYWVSFKDHGVYLFHTVPTNQAGVYDVAQAKKLGASANSHGCIRLSVADAKWFFENVPEGTPVKIH